MDFRYLRHSLKIIWINFSFFFPSTFWNTSSFQIAFLHDRFVCAKVLNKRISKFLAKLLTDWQSGANSRQIETEWLIILSYDSFFPLSRRGKTLQMLLLTFFLAILVWVHASVTFVTWLSGADGHLSAARSNDLLSKWLALGATKTTNS